MAMVTLTPACSSANTHLRDGSYSSYLNTAEETFLQKLSKNSNRKPSPPLIIASPPLDHLLLYADGKKPEDGEIGVFEAEKNFNGAINKEENPKISRNGAVITKTEFVGIPPFNPPRSVQLGTPSIQSESSWNSHSLLLQGALRNGNNNNQPQIKPSKRHQKSLLASLGCNCSCNDKNSVEIDDHCKKNESCKAVRAMKSCPNTSDLVQSNKSRLNPLLIGEIQCRKLDQIDQKVCVFNRQDCFSFPPLSSKTGNLMAKEEEDIVIQRKSLEVFGSPVQGMAKKSSAPDNGRLIASIWASTNPTLEDVQIRQSLDGTYDDTGSDTSSDLFEIESFSTNTNSNSLLIRQNSDSMSSCKIAPMGGYAPSEASIEWSVVTTRSANLSVQSVLSDYEDMRAFSFPSNVKKLVPSQSNALAKEVERRRYGGILLGCKSYKAVRVAGDAYRVSEKSSVLNGSRRHHSHRPESYVPMTRFGAENKVAGFDDPRNGQLGFDTHSFSRYHPAQYSRLMYA